jgi:hypothetical protein
MSLIPGLIAMAVTALLIIGLLTVMAYRDRQRIKRWQRHPYNPGPDWDGGGPPQPGDYPGYSGSYDGEGPAQPGDPGYEAPGNND